jgi:hypothetical protein
MADSCITRAFQEIATDLGISVPEFKRRLAAEIKNNWCHCKPEGAPVFHTPGCHPLTFCPRNKEHWHCGKCGKLTHTKEGIWQ